MEWERVVFARSRLVFGNIYQPMVSYYYSTLRGGGGNQDFGAQFCIYNKIGTITTSLQSGLLPLDGF